MKINKCVWLMGLVFWTFSSPSFSQDSTVCIAPSTARYYLEIEDEAIILREKDSISNQLIYNLSEVIDTKDRVIQTYKNDSIVYSAMEQSYNEHIQYVRGVVVKQEKRIGKIKFGNTVLLGATGGAIIGSTIPVVGTVIGAAGGAVVGTVVAFTKRNKN